MRTWWTLALLTLVVSIRSADAQPGAQPPQPEPPPQPQPQPEPAPQPPPPPEPQPSASDAQLIDAFVRIFTRWSTPEQRRLATEATTLLDPRAAAPLVFLMHDADPGVREAAARTLGRMPTTPPLDPRIEGALIAAAQQTNETIEVRVAAIESLRTIGADRSAIAVRDIYIAQGEPPRVHDAAKAVLAARWPDELNTSVPVVVDRRGRDGLIGAASLLGSYTLGAVGALGRNDAGTVIGILGGAVTGGVTAAYLTRSGEITRAQAAWIGSAGVWGASLGMTTAASIQANRDHRFVLSLGLLGEGAALTATIATKNHLTYSDEDIGEINAMGALGVDLALGALLLHAPRNDDRIGFAVTTGAAVVGLGAGLAIAPALHLTRQDGVLIGLAAYEAGFLGLLAPVAWASPVQNDNYYGAGALLGTGFGIIGAAAVGQVTEIPKRHVGMALLFGSYGKLLGYAVPLLATENSVPADARGVFIGSVAGLATGFAVADRLDDLREGDAALVAFGTGLGGWHGLGLSLAADATDRHTGGWTLLGTSVGGLGTIGLSRAVRIDPKEVQALSGGFFWGTWFAAWTAVLRDARKETALRATIAAGDAGLAVGGLLVSPVINIDARRVGIAYLGGLSGAALASLGAALATRDNDKLIGANLLGSAAGLALGALIAASWKFAPTTTKTTSVTPGAAGGLSLSMPMLGPMIADVPPGGHGAPAIGISATFLERL